MLKYPVKLLSSLLGFLCCLTLAASAKDPELPVAAAPIDVLLEGLKDAAFLAIDPHDALLLSEAEPGRILQIAADRTVTVLIDHLEDPAGLAVDPTGIVFVAAERELGQEEKSQKGMILRRDPKTQALSMVASEFKDPHGLTLDPHGTLFVSAKGRRGERDEKGALYSIESNGEISLLADKFKQPQGVLVRSDGSLLVAAERFGRSDTKVEGSLFRLDPTG